MYSFSSGSEKIKLQTSNKWKKKGDRFTKITKDKTAEVN